MNGGEKNVRKFNWQNIVNTVYTLFKEAGKKNYFYLKKKNIQNNVLWLFAIKYIAVIIFVHKNTKSVWFVNVFMFFLNVSC